MTNEFLQSPWFLVLIAWSIIWKGMALWRAAKNDSKPWFIVLVIVNTAGLLEILYLYVFGKKKIEKTDSTHANL